VRTVDPRQPARTIAAAMNIQSLATSIVASVVSITVFEAWIKPMLHTQEDR
jgi:hypothetical protein